MATNYKQNDPAWAYKPYAGENMAYAGCGPTATADLLNVTPPTIADWMSSHGEAGIPCYASNGSGTYAQGVVACLKAYGHDAEMITPHSMAGSLDNAYFIRFFNSIKQGYCGILLMGGTATGCKDNYWSKAGHYIAVVGYYNGKYLVYDPSYAARDGWHDYSDFAGDIKHCIITNIRWGGGDAIEVDGKWGVATTKLAQKVFGTPVDGEVSGQNEAMKKYLPACMPASWKFVPASKMCMGSALIRAIQHFLGIKADGFMGNETIVRLNAFLGFKNDPYFGFESVKRFQRWLNGR